MIYLLKRCNRRKIQLPTNFVICFSLMQASGTTSVPPGILPFQVLQEMLVEVVLAPFQRSVLLRTRFCITLPHRLVRRCRAALTRLLVCKDRQRGLSTADLARIAFAGHVACCCVRHGCACDAVSAPALACVFRAGVGEAPGGAVRYACRARYGSRVDCVGA